MGRRDEMGMEREECLELGMESFCGLHFGVKEKAVGGVLKRCVGVTLL